MGFEVDLLSLERVLMDAIDSEYDFSVRLMDDPDCSVSFAVKRFERKCSEITYTFHALTLYCIASGTFASQIQDIYKRLVDYSYAAIDSLEDREVCSYDA